MKSTRWKFRAVCGTATIMLGGCWTPAPYGYPSNPGYYAQPAPMYQPPPGVVVSPGVAYPAPQLGPPASPGGGSWTPSSPPMIAPGTGSPPLAPSNPGPLPGSPQTFGPPSGYRDPMPPRTQSDNLVPDPRDLGPSSRDLGPAPRPALPPDRPAPAPTNQNTTPFGQEEGKPFEGTQVPIPQRGADASKSIAERGEPFESPLDRGDKLDTGVINVAAKTSDAKTRVESPKQFDYDRVSYSYVRGVVDYNPRDKSWHIIYSPNPDRKDKYGGAFQLVDHPKLKALHDGDVVFIQGRISPRQLDAGGNAKYEVVDEVARVTYRGTQSVGN
jgi:hypothetical protein